MKFVIPRRIDWNRVTLVNVTIEAVEVVHDLEASKKSQLETQLTANELKYLAKKIIERASVSSNGVNHDCHQQREA